MKKVCVYKQQPNRNIPCPYIKVSPKYNGNFFKLDLDFVNLGCQHYVDRLSCQQPVPDAVWEGDGLLEELPAPLWLPLLLDRFLQKLSSENESLLLVIYEAC